jgi:transposase-like protein
MTTEWVKVECPDCWAPNGNRAQRREQAKRRARCKTCKGTGVVEKSVPVSREATADA